MDKINITEEFIDICDENNIDDENIILDNITSENINDIKNNLIFYQDKLNNLNNVYNNLKNEDDDILIMVQNEQNKYEKNRDEYFKNFGKVEMNLMDSERKLNELNSQIQNLQIQISQKKAEKNKILCDYNCNENKLKKLKYFNQRYGKNQILETFKNYANFYNKDIKEISIDNILNSSAGFEGWFKSKY